MSLRVLGASWCSISGLGINHEQKRADGSQEYYGKGPHLEMFWENTGQWGSQYTPAINTYIGSAHDGGDDPQIGYAPYDFDTRQNRNLQTSASAAISNYGLCVVWKEGYV